MSVGNDFLYSQKLQRRQWRRLLGLGLVVVGVMLLAGSGSYFLYAQIARSGLGELEVNLPLASEDPTGNGLVVAPEATQEPIDPTAAPADGAPENTQQPPAPTEAGSLYIPTSRFSTIYPGQGIHPKYWDAPYYAEAYKPAGWELVQSFEPASASAAKPVGSQGRATRIQIPAIGVDSDVRELRVVNLGTSAAWETPNQVVGHIPTTPNIGEAGRGYWFGHLESPIRGEGNVFINLPKIPDLLKKGEEIYVIFTNEDDIEYLYKVFNTTVVHQSELGIDRADSPLISLVACVPRLVYDHRLVVTAELVGIKQA
ncbi:MAG: Sortase (surface protein transpeptidase) [Chloroflexi bacterium]|jgi:sortase (surface protein transpeptidase)|nr:MAG: Sortase (surface protein transpeptidase) [Chloroflexota bacterium]